jgi:hypothetical protein
MNMNNNKHIENSSSLLLTKKMVAHEYSCSVSQIEELVKLRLLPPVKLFPDRKNSTLLFHSKDVYAFARKLRNSQNPTLDVI